jgi:hypothetical protein
MTEIAELFANNFVTTLADPITDNAEVAYLSNVLPTNLQQAGQFRFLLGTLSAGEYVIAEMGETTAQVTLVRGSEDTEASAWPAGTPVSQELTADALANITAQLYALIQGAVAALVTDMAAFPSLSEANTFLLAQTAPEIIVSGKTGASQPFEMAGATSSGAPVSGTFVTGDVILSLADGKWYTCTAGGTPGTWTTPSGSGNITSAETLAITGTPTSGQVLTATGANAADWATPSGGGGGGGMTYDETVLADDPVAYWLLNETSGYVVADATGNGHTGAYESTYSPGVGYTLGVTGPCSDEELAWEGTTGNGYISVPHSSALAITGDITLEGWVEMATIPTYGWLITKDSGATPSSYDFTVAWGGDGLFLTRGGVSNAGSAVLTTNVWHHVAVTMSGTAVTYFVDGASAGTTTITATITDAGAPVTIGTRGDFYTPLIGKLAKVAVYNTALSGTRIAAHYAAR